MNFQEVDTLCLDICKHLQENSNQGNKSLRRLRDICGLERCLCMRSTPSQNLNYLLKVQHLSESLLDFNIGISITNNYNTLSDEEHHNKALERILTYSLSIGPSEQKSQYLQRMWTYSGLKKFTITVIEEFITRECCFLEEDILNMFGKALITSARPHQALEESRYERLVLWSSNSPRIFCVVASIFNDLVQRTASSLGYYIPCTGIVSQFVSRVRLKCIENEKDFVSLYPLEFHALVSLLDIHPCSFPEFSIVKSSVTISTVVKLVKQQITRKPVQTLCILTHFPSWLPYINR